MRVLELRDYLGGWIMGDFEPAVIKHPFFELGFKYHQKDSHWDQHYHEFGTEVNVLLKGSMIANIDGEANLIQERQIFIIEPGEVCSPVFLTDCIVAVLKIPNLRKDKIVL